MPYPNLICDSGLVEDTIQLLKSVGGSADVVTVVEDVMHMRGTTPEMASGLISEIVGKDSRLKLNGPAVELNADAFREYRLDESTFVVFDLETTGAKAPPCRITEIGAFKVAGGRISEDFHTMVNPQTPIPEFISQLTGITDDMVADAPRFSEVLGGFLEFVGDSVLVAHNSQFDMRFLNYEIGLVHEEYKIANPSLCTVQLSRKLVPHIENHRLNTVARHFSIPLMNHHRAGDDARATAEIFINLLSELKGLGVEDVESARKLKRPQ
jgi:DNA polymerase III epsilon subunit family exonuclease